MTKSVVNVKLKRQHGWHIATSPDLECLIVCHQSMSVLLQEIPVCIKALYQANFNIEVEVEELISMENHDVSEIAFEAIKKAA